MLAKLMSHAVLGLDAFPVTVETDLGWGLPAFNIVGLPDAAVRESKERVRSGIANSEYEFPLRRITVNLAPADVRKEGPSFDLPIALSLLAASGQLKTDRWQRYGAVGELSLDGGIRRINGALAIAEAVQQSGLAGVLMPAANAGEAALIDSVEVIAVKHLREAVDFLSGELAIEPTQVDAAELLAAQVGGGLDLADVKGQEHARRALEVCAAGGHNLLMIGPPGSGKTMLARRLPSILPALSVAEAIAITRVYSIAGLIPAGCSVIGVRPFRSPHHTISHVGLAGGGSSPRPGEISLSHLGVLFLDELPEFSRLALEALRQPLEDGQVVISRALNTATYPARFMLVAAMNPCPCGYLGSVAPACSCPPHKISQYRNRISGPLLDRIDVAVEVPSLSKRELLAGGSQEASPPVAKRVAQARERQRRRFTGTGTFFNAQMSAGQVEDCCLMSDAALELMDGAFERLHLSARAHNRILKVARTIADLASSPIIEPAHVAEAISYRSLDRGGRHG